MTKEKLEFYKYEIRFKKRITKISSLEKKQALKFFEEPLNTTGVYKIYILRKNNRILYVGQTKRQLRSRLNYGLAAEGKNGYHGYKWKTEEVAEIIVFYFMDRKYDQELIETIEGEIVYLVRKKTGHWPIFQNEIHFHNVKDKSAFQIANEIYSIVS
ncbi:GIY-YIG nuclease family protein [Leptospira selangorensis]|uniref:GIY-YIG nuclease family protein n=1 Tax=Leptospira selangorensis TaxID=2484982 RepID=UPI00142D8585|nr:GIY-YIG nuclease family protein [Leptospira selangorensis]